MRRRGLGAAGFTLVELLIASAIVTVLLGALGGILATSSRAYQANERQTQSQQSIDAVLQFLRYDIRLAGYAGRGGEAELGGTPIEVESNPYGSGESLTVRYFEDRYGPQGLVTVSYYVTDSGLMRDSGLGPEVLAPEVTDFEVSERSAKAIRMTFARAGQQHAFAVAFADPEQAAD